MIRRIIVSAVLFCILLGMIITGNISSKRYYKSFCDELDYIEQMYVSGEDVTKLTDRAEARWVEAEKLLTAYQNRGIIDEVGRSFARLTPIAKAKDDAMFLSEIKVIKLMLLEMKQSEGISIESLM